MIVVSQANAHSPFILPAWKVVFQCDLQNNVEEQARQRITVLVTILISNMSLSSSIITVASWFLYNLFKRLMYSCSIPQVSRASQIELCVMEPKAFMKSIAATHIFDSPLMASLFNHSVRHQMIHSLICASGPCLIFCLDLIKSGIKSAVQYCRKQFVQHKQRADRATVSNIFNVTFFVYHFYSFSLPRFWCAFFCFITSSKICLTISFVSSAHALMCSALV